MRTESGYVTGCRLGLELLNLGPLEPKTTGLVACNYSPPLVTGACCPLG